MDFTEIIIEIKATDVETAAAVSNMVVPHGIYIEDYSNLEVEAQEIAHINLIDEKLLAKKRDIALIHVYISPEENPLEAISFLQQRFDSIKIKYKISTQSCKMEDYINNWKKYFKPIPVGNKLLICPSWEKLKLEPSERIILQLDPGLAFGTGTHETTRLCLEQLENYIKPSSSVLDVGCGSGILSVASLLLGAKNVVGVDIDELAVKTAYENAEINNVKNNFVAVRGNLTENISGKFDIIVANIVADVIIELNKIIKNYMYKNSIYLMSGIIEPYKNDVLKSLENDFEVLDIKNENGWFAIIAKQKNK